MLMRLTDDQILREVMNTVGKPGKLGEVHPVRCQRFHVDRRAGTPTRSRTSLGVRAFGTQLLCEQVIGRGLRRMSYHADEDGIGFHRNTPRSTVFPSPFIPCSGGPVDIIPVAPPTRIRALGDRIACEITFPRV
jgi:type III restriction enzyme